MLNRNLPVQVYLARDSIDMRKSIDGLAAIVQESFLLDPFSSSLFVFCNKSKNKIKVLQWEDNGFWLYYKRLEKGTFNWPKDNKTSTIKVEMRTFGWLLDGLPLNQKEALGKIASKAVI